MNNVFNEVLQMVESSGGEACVASGSEIENEECLFMDQIAMRSVDVMGRKMMWWCLQYRQTVQWWWKVERPTRIMHTGMGGAGYQIQKLWEIFWSSKIRQ